MHQKTDGIDYGMDFCLLLGSAPLPDGRAQHERWACSTWTMGMLNMADGQVALANDEVRLQMEISVIEIGAFAALNMRLIEVCA